MKLSKRTISILIAAVLIIGCVTSPFKPVKDTNRAFERRDYSVLPPQEPGWKYMSYVDSNKYALIFGKLGQTKNHSFMATVREEQIFSTFSSPEDFLAYIKKSKELSNDPRRFKSLEEKLTLSNRFGPFTVSYAAKTEDHGTKEKGKLDFLLLNIYEYIFIHPNNKNIMITISYSERGASNEVDANFPAKSEQFMKGLIIK